ncbi:MAG: hypothetical protein CMF48_02995 [Legionellales bacterium]|nr:hypothetical protein [Legionellales bacterium]|tara:strand:- start:895 stop:1653 length:759 start_codon:yes stop_codon:yes gene_type:complete
MRPPFAVRCNFSDESVALVQHLSDLFICEADRANIFIVYTDTGWASPVWSKRVEHCLKWAEKLGFSTLVLKADIQFADAVISRGQFPTVKNQWCASMLKGMPFLNWLNKFDPFNEMTILIPKRQLRQASPLSEWIDECPFHGDRTVWHPLVAHTNEKIERLISKTPFSLQRYPISQECYPCVRHLKLIAQEMDSSTRLKVNALETQVNKTYFGNISLDKGVLYQLSYLSPLHLQSITYAEESGCSAPFGCGL